MIEKNRLKAIYYTHSISDQPSHHNLNEVMPFVTCLTQCSIDVTQAIKLDQQFMNAMKSHRNWNPMSWSENKRMQPTMTRLITNFSPAPSQVAIINLTCLRTFEMVAYIRSLAHFRSGMSWIHIIVYMCVSLTVSHMALLIYSVASLCLFLFLLLSLSPSLFIILEQTVYL